MTLKMLVGGMYPSALSADTVTFGLFRVRPSVGARIFDVLRTSSTIAVRRGINCLIEISSSYTGSRNEMFRSSYSVTWCREPSVLVLCAESVAKRSFTMETLTSRTTDFDSSQLKDMSTGDPLPSSTNAVKSKSV